MCATLQITPEELADHRKQSRKVSEAVWIDPLYENLVAIVDRRIGELISTREELHRKIINDREAVMRQRKRLL